MKGEASLIPAHLTYVQQMKRFEYQTLKAGFKNTHGLRHAYAQKRYETLTGMKCPLQGGKRWQEMSKQERERDREARLIISGELGHARLGITNTYLGKASL